MKKAELISAASASLSKIGFRLKKHSPEIFVVAGVAGTVASAVMACRATTKISVILDETKNTVNAIRDCAANETLAEAGKYSNPSFE